MGLCAFIWPTPTRSSRDVVGTARHAPVVPGGHSEACLSCGEFTAPGDLLFWKTAHNPRGCGNGGTVWGAASLGGGVGAPHEERSSEVGKRLQRHHVLLLQAQCGSEPPAGPWAHCPHSPSACRMPAPHGCPVKGSLLASLPGSRNCLCFLSQADWTLWGSSAQGHKSYPGKRE